MLTTNEKINNKIERLENYLGAKAELVEEHRNSWAPEEIAGYIIKFVFDTDNKFVKTVKYYNCFTHGRFSDDPIIEFREEIEEIDYCEEYINSNAELQKNIKTNLAKMKREFNNEYKKREKNWVKKQNEFTENLLNDEFCNNYISQFTNEEYSVKLSCLGDTEAKTITQHEVLATIINNSRRAAAADHGREFVEFKLFSDTDISDRDTDTVDDDYISDCLQQENTQNDTENDTKTENDTENDTQIDTPDTQNYPTITYYRNQRADIRSARAPPDI